MSSRMAGQFARVLHRAVLELRQFARRRPAAHPPSPLPSRRPRLGLALGGGFARGIAHIGVLKVLTENQITIDALAGISAGSFAAATFASGCTIEEMTSVARNLRWSSFARWQFPRLGFANNERFEHLLSKVLRCRTFEQLRIPLAIVAADILSGEAVIFREGDLMLPLRASCSFPGLFAPIDDGPRMLVDGMIVGSVPTTALREMDVIVAVHLPTKGLRERPTNFFQVVGECFHIAQRLSESAWRDHADLVIEPEVGDFNWDAFSRADELIRAGEVATRKALPALRRLLAERAAARTSAAAVPAGKAAFAWTASPPSTPPARPTQVTDPLGK